MTAAFPPPLCTFMTLSKNEMLPRWQRTTAPPHAPMESHNPPLVIVPDAVPRAANSMWLPLQVTAPSDRVLVSRHGTVDSTPTPGAARSTCALCCENEATVPLESSAATETTDAYE